MFLMNPSNASLVFWSASSPIAPSARFFRSSLANFSSSRTESAAVALLNDTKRCPALDPRTVSTASSPPSPSPHAAMSCSLHPRLWPAANTGIVAVSYPSLAAARLHAASRDDWHSLAMAPWSTPSSYGVAMTTTPASSPRRLRNASYAMWGYDPSTAPPTKCTTPHARPGGHLTHAPAIFSHPSPPGPPRAFASSMSMSRRRERSSMAAPTVPNELGANPSSSSSAARGGAGARGDVIFPRPLVPTRRGEAVDVAAGARVRRATRGAAVTAIAVIVAIVAAATRTQTVPRPCQGAPRTRR
mmetsp:Transcript_12778/g.54135  ORF Transcript_12778/g.54135 Transcript_12778/m.54135 type:complete len:301 (-) Transcript_12778:12-914(-)